MSFLRRLRRCLPAWLVVSLLFMQGMTLAHACLGPAGMAAADAGAAAMAAMPDCAEAAAPAVAHPAQPAQLAESDPALACKTHCEADAPSMKVSAAALADAASAAVAPDAALAGVLPEPSEADRRAARIPAGAGDGPPRGAPPLYLALHVLRN